MDERHAGTAYVALPDEGEGPGVLVLHAWWGLTDFFRDVCDRLAAEGFVALAPDLFEGATAATVAEGERQLVEASADRMAHLTRSSLAALAGMPATITSRLGVLGFSMGGSLALWLSARVPEAVAATTVFYGGQDIDFAASTSAYLGHFADRDDYVDDDGLTLLEAELRLVDRPVEFHRYPDTEHWFFEADRPEFDPEAASLAWDRTVRFLHDRLG